MSSQRSPLLLAVTRPATGRRKRERRSCDPYQGERPRARTAGRAAPRARRCAAPRPRVHRHTRRLRAWYLRCMHGAGGRAARAFLPHVRCPSRWQVGGDGGGARHARGARPAAAGIHRSPRPAVRVLHAGFPDAHYRVPAGDAVADGRGDPRSCRVEPVPVHRVPGHPPRGAGGRGRRCRKLMSYVGSRVRRLEDPRLLTGTGRFADDQDRPGQLWMRVVRSQVAHATLGAVDTSGALALDGIRAVLTAADVILPPIPVRVSPDPSDLLAYLQPVLAQGRVRYVREPVAVVVADHPAPTQEGAHPAALDYPAL